MILNSYQNSMAYYRFSMLTFSKFFVTSADTHAHIRWKRERKPSLWLVGSLFPLTWNWILVRKIAQQQFSIFSSTLHVIVKWIDKKQYFRHSWERARERVLWQNIEFVGLFFSQSILHADKIENTFIQHAAVAIVIKWNEC